MVRRLQDLCLRCAGRNFGRLAGQQISKYLSFQQKEILLERMASHMQLTSDVLPAITYYLFSSKLRKISFWHTDQITDEFLTQLGRCCPFLVHISLDKCQELTDTGLMGLFRPQRELVELELKKMPKGVTGACFADLRCALSLRIVSLHDSKAVGAEAVRQLVSNNGGMRELSVEGLVLVGNSTVESVAQTLAANLEVLNISWTCSIQETSLLALARHCPNLHTLVVGTNNLLTGEGLDQVFANCRIASLDISCCFKMLSMHLHALYKKPECLSHLACLHYASHLPPQTLLTGLPHFIALRELDISGSMVDDGAIEAICSQTGSHLTGLLMSVCNAVTDVCCHSIARHCMRLSQLRMSILPSLTCEGLLPLFSDDKRAKHIQQLDFGGTNKLDESVVRAISSNCHNIVHMVFSGCTAVDDDTLELMAENCFKTEFLFLKRCSKITDDGLLHIVYNCPLRVLVVSGCRNITDRSMIPLAENCERLEEVYISGNTSITRAAARFVEDMGLSRVYVRHTIPNVPDNLLIAKNLDTGKYERMS